MTIGKARFDIAQRLREAGVEDAASDADWLLVALTGHVRSALPLYKTEALTRAQCEALAAQIRRRVAGEPLQYILGSQDFLGLSFLVDERVLIPRPETELLCELALAEMDNGAATALDLCCGSGCIGVALAKLRPGARVWASDDSEGALEVARENARRLAAAVTFLRGDLLRPAAGLRFDLIVCNPPYIPSGAIAALSREVRREPASALDGGGDGLDFYRRIAEHAPAYLSGQRVLLLEVGHDQAESVAALCEKAGAHTETAKDYQGIARFVRAQWREEGTRDV